jgi:hypothetical protein
VPRLQVLDIFVNATIGEEVFVTFPVFQDVKYVVTSFQTFKAEIDNLQMKVFSSNK